MPTPDSPSEPAAPPTAPKAGPKKAIITLLKITIAVLGIWFVAHKIHWIDTATLAPNTTLRNIRFPDPVDVDVLSVDKSPPTRTGTPREDTARIRFGSQKVKMDVQGETIDAPVDENLITRSGPLGLANEITVPLSFLQDKNGERIQEGLRTLTHRASGKWYLLLAAWTLLGIPFFVTAIRWRNLMRPQGINMPLGKCLQLTFVGQFYSIMLPGITGGDLVKIVYAARLTGSKTKSFITIILDRVIGLIALMIIAGASAGIQLFLNNRNNAGAHMDNTLLNVFLMITALLALLATAAIIYFSHRLRRLVGIEWFVEHFADHADPALRHQKLEHLFRVVNILLLLLSALLIAALATLRWALHSGWATKNTPIVYLGIGAAALLLLLSAAALLLHARLVDRLAPLLQKAVGALVKVDETLHVYRGHFGLLAWALFISLISQLTLPLSAWLSGSALGMTAPVTHYLAYVPIAVLAASLPISPPQGFGVMDWIIVHFFADQGTARASQAFALTQAIRFLPMIWNLFGAIFVVTGSFSRKEPPPDTAPAQVL